MSLFFYGVCIFGVIFGGLVLVVLYSLLVMAKRSEECLDLLELKMLQGKKCAAPFKHKARPESYGGPNISDLYQGGAN
jgi:hypothetical protein